MNIKGLEFDQTCWACPEQYDVYCGKLQVGYVRLRWGNLTVDYPDYNGELIYEASIGDGLAGGFESEEQRNHYLNIIADKILEKQKRDIMDKVDLELQKHIDRIGYKGCKNCKHQISPLRMCRWAEQGGDGSVHLVCPMWDKAESKVQDDMETFEETQNKLRECINHAYRDEYEDMQKFGSNVKHLDKAMTLLNELVEESKKEQWIPVTERLPEEDGTYLVSELVYSSDKPRGYGYEPSQNIVDFVEFSIVNGWRRAKSFHEVTAWMPLPKPVSSRHKCQQQDRK